MPAPQPAPTTGRVRTASGSRPSMEFHIARSVRDRYELDASLFGLAGNVVVADLAAARRLLERMNADRDPATTLQPGALNAMGLIDEILHYVVGLYRRQRDPAALAKAIEMVESRLGRDAVDATLLAFVEAFPSSEVYRGRRDPAGWLAESTDGVANREIALEELLLLWLANVNPAFAPFRELFDDSGLRETTAYPELMAGLAAFFATMPPFGPDSQQLVAMLRSPAIAVPESLSGQLRYIRERWAGLLGDFLDRLLLGLDVLTEEEVATWRRFHPGFGGAGGEGAIGLGLGGVDEPERYSMDRDWMPKLVLLAKSTYVWLDQLSKEYGRDIVRLDQIPEAELDRLARAGFTGLWLIGLWERSKASQRIKQLRGNADAVASAYSLDEYRIADDLGGEEAYANLRDRAWARGIRLASDMVPNHMGIDSRWVMDHPEWFIGLDHPPYPGYTYGGPDLSSDERVGVFLEDHYYDSTDAAVVFRRTDRWSGSERFIYHGNDGTSMPWNDTAQLDYLNPEVREAVIRTILEVARRFPVIRFDAAMTLAKKHVQRLWYPAPGSGGAIPSRSEHGSMPPDAFDRAIPVEFWREVVDRVAAEVPDTLLLAEAFWLMEGYFVRTLGMHRVYNSAFMNMLRDEKNAEYRLVMKNTLEFDPEILKRYVNFMNNPDEKTAVDQFGKGDKYFGVATLMSTLPGLPMVGHGQIEGYAEKYGMEFRRAYWAERPDPGLVAEHERRIFPLLHRRALFAEVRDFRLYDLVTADGHVNEDVFAYSNRSGGERVLVVYHNRYAEAKGWIRESVAFSQRDDATGQRSLVRRTTGEGLGLHGDDGWYAVLRDAVTGQEFLRRSRDIVDGGLYVELGAYECLVFLGVHEVWDGAGRTYGRLHDRLGGRGVPSIEDALRELVLEPIHEPLRGLLDPVRVERVRDAARDGDRDAVKASLDEFAWDVGRLAGAIVAGPAEDRVDADAAGRRGRASLEAFIRLAKPAGRRAAGDPVETTLDAGLWPWTAILAWAALQALDPPSGAGLDADVASADERPQPTNGRRARARRSAGPAMRTKAAAAGSGRPTLVAAPVASGASMAGPGSRLDTLRLGRVVADRLRDAGLDEGTAWRTVEAVRALLDLPPWPTGTDGARVRRILETWAADEAVRRFLQVNRWEDVVWFGRDPFEAFVALAATTGAIAAEGTVDVQLARALIEAGNASGYQLERLVRPPADARA